MTSRPVLGRLATGVVTVALAAGLGSALSTAAADTTAPSPANTKMSLQQAIGCGGNASYFWCR